MLSRAVWSLGLTLGAALVIHPALGTGVRSSNDGPTPTNFVTALAAAGNSLSVVGSSEFAPRTAPYRLLYLFNSLAGMSALSLTLTYLTSECRTASLRRFPDEGQL